MATTPFQVEAWAEYAIGIVILSSRIAYRISVVGWNWHGDDYFAVAAAIFLTGETAMLEMIGQWGSIVGMTDKVALSLTDAQKATIVKGAKADIAGWCLYITLIWCLKACMLFFYRRLTLETQQRRLVYVAAVACICSYIATIGVVLLRCLPFYRNWQIYPYPGDECGSPNQIFLTLVITNVSTDLLILYIPLPLLWVVQLPWSRKIVYGLWLTTGIFVIVASLLRCILSIRDSTEVDISTIWAIRETFVGIISVNAPILGPWIIRKCTFIAQSVTSKDRSATDGGNKTKGLSIITIGRRSYRMDRLKRDDKRQHPPGWTTINDSEEYIMDEYAQDSGSHAAGASTISNKV
ncbi:hypothetical protein QQS21_010983 [Conoideocrella luteorostrata]|uniref:Rhodopsin domain-containing protein n=1 Tax=Conoideocrella luteorostrata TaxID=1105319 RepID=A0AAJ0FWB4_9HYPO|nr:hypothetical protein QQS21_010983 [Conoideocrella luteorostrata]